MAPLTELLDMQVRATYGEKKDYYDQWTIQNSLQQLDRGTILSSRLTLAWKDILYLVRYANLVQFGLVPVPFM